MPLVPQTPGVPDHAAADPSSDARNRALRTFLQGLVVDVLLAVAIVAGELLTDDVVDWRVLGLVIAKTALMAAASYVHRKLAAPPAVTP